jgi:hypothetical protein
VSTWCQTEAANIGVKSEQLPGGGKGDRESPRLPPPSRFLFSPVPAHTGVYRFCSGSLTVTLCKRAE